MRTEERASDEFIFTTVDSIEQIQKYLKDNRKKVNNLLPWITEASEDELQFVEDYFINKYQVLPSLKSFLKDPILISFDNIEELFDTK